MKYVPVSFDESSGRTLTGRWEFDRTKGGTLLVPTVSTFPTETYARELIWNTTSGAFYVRNEQNTDWRLVLGAPAAAPFVVLTSTGSLFNERQLAAAPSIVVTDGGAGSTVSLSISNASVATVSGTQFTGPVSASRGLSGSLQQVSVGLPYLLAGAGVMITTAVNGQVFMTASTPPTGADNAAAYLMLTSNSTLPAERIFNASGSAVSVVDTGTSLTLDISSTVAPGTYQGRGIAVNNKGQVTSGSTTWFGQHLWYVTGSSAQPFSNPSTTYLAALTMTASNLTPGIYRFGWSYVYYRGNAASSFRARCFILNSASYDTVEEVSEIGANERLLRSGFAFVRVTDSIGLFALEVSEESGTTVTRIYDRALELWKVS